MNAADTRAADTRTKILLVEDDVMLREAFRLLLEESGYEVHEAGSAADALRTVAAENPALVLLDLGLPDRSGLEVARELTRSPEARQPLVFALTGSVGPEERRACLEAGCTFYLAKPIEPRQLLRRISEVLG